MDNNYEYKIKKLNDNHKSFEKSKSSLDTLDGLKNYYKKRINSMKIQDFRMQENKNTEEPEEKKLKNN